METLIRLLILGLLLGILWALYMYQEYLHEEENKIISPTKNHNQIKKNSENVIDNLEEMSADSLNFDETSSDSGIYKRDSMIKSTDSTFIDDDSNANSLFA